MGLFERARILSIIAPPRDKNHSPAEQFSELIAKLHAEAGKIDYTAEVFRHFRCILGFSKGALLLPDESGEVFHPWIAEGFDRTTLRRLRISADFPALKEASSVYAELEPEELAELVSNRELGLLIAPFFILLGELTSPAALILASNRPDNEIDPELIETLRGKSLELGEGVRKSRDSVADNEDDIIWTDWLESWGGGEAGVMVLDASDAVDTVMKAIPGLELYRARRDTVGLLRHITGRMGRVFDLKDGRVITIFSLERMPEPDLYLNQLSRGFHDAYSDLGLESEFTAEVLEWPGERDALNRRLSGA